MVMKNRIHFDIAKCKIIYRGIKDVDSTYKVEDSLLKNCDSKKVFGFKITLPQCDLWMCKGRGISSREMTGIYFVTEKNERQFGYSI